MSLPSDLPPDEARLRVLETWLLLILDRVRASLAHLEQQAAIQRKSEQAKPPPEWTLETSINGRTPLTVHAGDCRMGGSQVRTRPLSREDAIRALTVGGVKACEFCRPNSELGILD
ncbi:DUF6233 domain-containing protein [Streptomyces sp. NPDC059881]|uniref:DUF6233 domain-containing protein n=1 Tax=Streptomyces sp. NPDC059881 TaxID=3346986 RepID=UPI00364C85DB